MDLNFYRLVTKKEKFDKVQEKKRILKTIENHKGKMFGHVIRRGCFLRSIIRGPTEGKQREGKI